MELFGGGILSFTHQHGVILLLSCRKEPRSQYRLQFLPSTVVFYLVSKNPHQILSARRRMIIEDMVIGFVMPVILTLLTYIPQGHRSNILEDLGCKVGYYNTVPGILLLPLPTVILGIGSAIYGGLNLKSFLRRQKALKAFLTSDSSSLGYTQYLRLMGLGVVDAFVTVPLSLYILKANVKDAGPVHPWVWAEVKADYEAIWRIPRSQWDTPNGFYTLSFKISLWFNILTAIFFFGFFGCSKGILGSYINAWRSVCRRVRGQAKQCPPMPRPETYIEPMRFSKAVPRSSLSTISSTVNDIPGNRAQTPFTDPEMESDVSGPTTTFGSMSVASIHDIDLERGDTRPDNGESSVSLPSVSTNTRVSVEGGSSELVTDKTPSQKISDEGSS
ncbi:hypothetical protein HGRIS_003532 [Hohenbuehelia grisea]|uniref:Pheromone receptor n=1 Tax=Hohenbuehelia grisea TaxID=104357 RepID=A0ABR3JGP1_9AGAR